MGLDESVMEGYHWLVTTYQPDDRIALFGFSRGAYTARSLAGLIKTCGLLNTVGMHQEEIWRRIKDVYDRYRQAEHGDPHWRDGLTFLYDPADAENIPVNFIGVWDTVGSLGIPDHLRWLAPGFSASRHAFHDMKLNRNVKHGRHAVAMDERRGSFSPALWDEPEPGQDVKQVWFPGSHMDVGGGHRETGLSDRALQWMIDEARSAIQLGFRKTTEEQLKPDALDVMHNDDRTALGWLNPLLAPGLRRHPSPRRSWTSPSMNASRRLRSGVDRTGRPACSRRASPTRSRSGPANPGSRPDSTFSPATIISPRKASGWTATSCQAPTAPRECRYGESRSRRQFVPWAR
jgi:hypothetical protein